MRSNLERPVIAWLVALPAGFLILWAFNYAIASFFLSILAGNLLVIGGLVVAIVTVVVLVLRNRPKELSGLIAEKAGWTPAEHLTPEAQKLRAWMRRLVEPTFLLVTAQERGFSKLGGAPALGNETLWPQGRSKPCDFLLQVDFDEVPSEGPDWLPWSGRLYVFLDPEGNGATDQIKLIYHDGPAPSELIAHQGREPFPEIPITFKRFRSAPSVEWLGSEAVKLDRSAGDADLQGQAAGVGYVAFDGVTHRIGGYPTEVQDQCLRLSCELSARKVEDRWPEFARSDIPGDADIEKASKDWRLLLQIDSDRRLGWDWVSGGTMFVFVRRQDARRHDFSRPVTLCQYT